MPITINSVVNAFADGSVDVFQFAAKQGERVIIRCAGRRIDSRMRPIVRLLNTAGNQLAFSRATHRREPLLDFVAPADENYLIKISDVTYRGGDSCFYRLELSTRPYIDFVYPPSGTPGTTSRFTLYGHNLPGSTPAKVFLGHRYDTRTTDRRDPGAHRAGCLGLSPSSNLKRPVEAEVEGFVYRWNSTGGTSNPVFISLAQAPVVLEQEQTTRNRSRNS